MQDVRSAVEISLDRMQSEAIDLMQFHAWNYANPYWLDCLFWLQELKEEGLIKNIGLTNFDSAHLRIALNSGVEIISNQVSHSLLDQRAGSKMSEVCQEFNIKLLVFGKEKLRVKLRAKGDRLVHRRSFRNMSFKVDIKGEQRFEGMEEFSLQTPSIRNYLSK